MSPLPLADDPRDELDILAAWEANWLGAQQRAGQWNLDGLIRLSQWAANAPWVEPEAMVSLARSGVDFDSPAGRAALETAGFDYHHGWRQGREPGEPPAVSRRRRGGGFWSRASSVGTGAADAGRRALGDEMVRAALGPTPIEEVLAGRATAAQILADNDGATWGDVVDLHNEVVAYRREMAAAFGGDWLERHLGPGAHAPEDRQRGDGRADVRNAARSGSLSAEETTAAALDEQMGSMLQKAPEDGSGFRIPFTDVRVRPPGLPDVSGGIPVPFTDVDDDFDQASSAAREGPVGDVLRAGLRTGFAVLNAPIQESVGQFRAAVGRVRRDGWGALLDAPPVAAAFSANQSDLGVVVDQLTQGEPVDMGGGYFVGADSGVARQRIRRERQHGTIDGLGITPGRWFASTFTGLDPGDTGYGLASGVVDFAVNVGLDPANLAGGATVRGARQGRGFTRAGSLGEEAAVVADEAVTSRHDLARQAAAEGRPRFERPPEQVREEAVGLFPAAVQPDLDRETFSGWLLAGDGRRVVEELAAETDFYALRRGTGGKLDSATLLRLADSTDVDEVTNILFDAGKLTLDRTFTYRAPNLREGTWTRRAFSQTPVSTFRPDDPDAVLDGIEGLLVNARVAPDVISRRMRQAAEAQTPIGRVAAVEGALDDVAERLIVDGMGPDAAKAVTRHIKEWGSEENLYNTVDGVEIGALPEHVRIADGEGGVTVLNRSHIAAEMAPNVIHLPHQREIKRLTSVLNRMGPLFVDPATGKWDNIGHAIGFLEGASGAWRKLTLARVAWPVRVGLDEQMRMAASGVPSMWSSPLHWLMTLTDRKTDRLLMEALDEPNGAYQFTELFQRALLRNGTYEPNSLRRVGQAVWKRVPKSNSNFVRDWGRELGQLSAGPIERRLAASGSVDEVVEAMMRGDLAVWRREMSVGHLTESLADEAGVRRYVETVWNRIRHKTGDNPDILEAVANGFFHGADGTRIYFSEPGTWKPSEGLEDMLGARVDSAPDAVKGERLGGTDVHPDDGKKLDRVVDRAFYLLGAAPSNMLARSPSFLWYQFEALAERMPMFTAEAQDAILELAGKYRVAKGVTFEVGTHRFGFGDKLLERLERARFDGRGARVTGEATFDDALLFGRAEGMRRTLDLLGDFSRKNQMADALRLVAPFGSAWQEQIQAYARLIRENPLIVYNIEKGVNAAMESGFFYTDQNGELVFAYPGVGELLSKLPGAGTAPFPVTGRVQGLTMGLEIMPGLGPVATLPLSLLIPDTPSWDFAREVLIPYGSGKGIDILVPEWLEKIGTSLRNNDNQWFQAAGSFLGGDTRQSTAQWGSSVIDVATYLLSTGEYGTSEPEVARLLDDAMEHAGSMWFWRGILQSVLPSAPRFTPVFDTGDGDTILIGAMFERLRELRDEDPIHAGERFLDEYGTMALGLLSPKTESNAIYIPYDKEGFDWLRDNSALVDRYPEIGTLFAPSGGGPAGMGAYLRRVESGAVEPVDARDWIYRGQDALGSILYNRFRETIDEQTRASGRSEPPEEWQDALREYRESLFEIYPGYMRDGRSARDLERTIASLRNAVEDESVFAESPAGVALSAYLALRDQALAQLRASTAADSLASQSAEPLRAALYQYGSALVESHPDFINLWERVLLREVELEDVQ